MSPASHATPRVEALDNRRVEIASEIRRVLLAASAQEAALLGVANRPLRASLAEITEPGLLYFGVPGDGHTLTGWISLEPAQRPGEEAYITSLVVDPEQQRRGVARALLEAALQQVAPGALRVSTPTMNAPALALYAGSGFIEAGRALVGATAIEVVLLRHPGQPRMP